MTLIRLIPVILLTALLGACADEVPRRAARWDGVILLGDAMQREAPDGGSLAPPAAPDNGQSIPDSGGSPPTTPDSGASPTLDSAPPPPQPGSCDPSFLGPFCTVSGKNKVIIGFDSTPATANPTLAEVRKYSLDAVNYIRAMTCLPPLTVDSCLEGIAEAALAANAGHGYFLANCMNAAHNYGKSCTCGWTQENIGAAFGTGRTWKDGIQSPLCNMMEEPKGVGHRGNIESSTWKRIGMGIKVSSSGAMWYHEFGN